MRQIALRAESGAAPARRSHHLAAAPRVGRMHGLLPPALWVMQDWWEMLQFSMTAPEGMPNLRAPHLHQAVGRCMIDLVVWTMSPGSKGNRASSQLEGAAGRWPAQLARSVVAGRAAIGGSNNEDFV